MLLNFYKSYIRIDTYRCRRLNYFLAWMSKILYTNTIGMKRLLCCLALAVSFALNAQEIQVQVLKDQVSADTISATFGEEVSSKDPQGRRAFSQWVIQQLDSKRFLLEEPALFLFSFKVDEKGAVKKVQTKLAQNKKIGSEIERIIKLSPSWKPYAKCGVAQATLEYFGIVLQPSKGDGEALRLGFYIPPQYPKDGISGFIASIDKKLKDPDFRYEAQKQLTVDRTVQLELMIDREGKLSVFCNSETPVDLAQLIKKKVQKSEPWIPGLYLTKPAPYKFALSYTLSAWDESKEGEKVEETKRAESSVNKEIQRRADERARQSDVDAMRSGSGSSGGGGGSGGRIR